LLTLQEGGMFKQLDYSSDENIRKDVGEYNNHFTRPGDDQDVIFTQPYMISQGWWRGTVVERRSLAGELSLSCARPAADG